MSPRPTPATDQADRAYAANLAALRFATSTKEEEREAVETALDLTRVHFAWFAVLNGDAREVA